MIEQAKTNLRKMNKVSKTLKIVGIVLNILVVLGVFYFLLAPATNLMTDIGKYTEDGYNYYGWQLAILGCGYPPLNILCMFEETSAIAGDYIPNMWDFDTNSVILSAIILAIVGIIAGGIVCTKMKNKGKAIAEIVVAILLVYAGIVLVNCASLSVLTAADMGAGVGFKNQYLMPAIEAGTYYTLLYPVLICGLCILTALFKAGRGVFLLYQKAYANKYLKANES